MNPIRAILLAALLAPALAVSAAATRYYVDADAAPGGDGASWASAFDTLDAALALIQPGDRIWIAEGTYTPSIETIPGDPRSATFHVPGGVHLYGGFDGTELDLDSRAGLFSTTILSGELGAPGAADNSYHVVHVEHPSGVPQGGNRIDGFVITGGNANGTASGSVDGGGVLSFNVTLRLENVTVRGNAAVNGAGVHAQPASLRLVDCVIEDNRATNNGGALWGHAINIKAYNTVMRGNAAGARGGAVYIHAMFSGIDYAVFGNCILHDNFAPVGGGAFIGGGNFSSGAASFRNCTFAFNRASDRGGALRANTAPLLPARVELHNSILWNNSAPLDPGISGRPNVSYCNLQDSGWSSAFGNLSEDPLFVNATNRDLRLSPGSPCTDAGDNAQATLDYLDLDDDGILFEAMPYDITGARRFADDASAPNTGTGPGAPVDLGAHERPGS